MGSKFQCFWDALFGRGFSTSVFGGDSLSYVVETSLFIFLNHGCNNTFHLGESVDGLTELTADPDVLPHSWTDGDGTSKSSSKLLYAYDDAVYSPYIDRNALVFLSSIQIITKPVPANTEVLENYLQYTNSENWKRFINIYSKFCAKEKPHSEATK